jgi:hypothetical protein
MIAVWKQSRGKRAGNGKAGGDRGGESRSEQREQNAKGQRGARPVNEQRIRER